MKFSSDTISPFLAVLFGLVGAVLIISTYGTLTQTYDEPFHIATGMEWLQHGSYTIEQLHPPIGRVAVALNLYLTGNTLSNEKSNSDFWQQGNGILHSGDSYTWNLALARLGVLPFFLLTTCIVWLWTRMLFGRVAGLFAVILFTTLPPVLGHSGLATTDMAGAAGFFAALFCFVVWLERGGVTQSSILGVAVGLALTSKFSNFLFLPVCVGAIGLSRLVKTKKAEGLALMRIETLLHNLCLIVAVAFITMWAVYRFHYSSFIAHRSSTPQYDR
jgi:hypothetical protein